MAHVWPAARVRSAWEQFPGLRFRESCFDMNDVCQALSLWNPRDYIHSYQVIYWYIWILGRYSTDRRNSVYLRYLLNHNVVSSVNSGDQPELFHVCHTPSCIPCEYLPSFSTQCLGTFDPRTETNGKCNTIKYGNCPKDMITAHLLTTNLKYWHQEISTTLLQHFHRS